jgi:IS30 family transposase
VLKKELLRHLRSKRSMRRSKPVDPNGDRRGHIKDIVSIRQRPAAIEDRAVPGHWEGDLLSGPNNSYIATLVERHTRYVMLAKVAGKDTQTVVSALIKQARKLPKELYESLDLGPGQGTYGSSSLYVGDQNRRLFLRSAKPVAARVEREYQWPAETVLS